MHLERQDEAHHRRNLPQQVFQPVYHPPFEARSSFSNRSSSTSSTHSEEAPAAKKKSKAAGKFITSPMVGTFYASASPDDPVFVKVGDKVDENTVVCIIEAMKVMNEVKAGVSGTVAEILVDNAHPVEFGTKLFRIV